MIMPYSTIKFIIKSDGNVEEEVQEAMGHSCQQITKPIEDALGEVIVRNHISSCFITFLNFSILSILISLPINNRPTHNNLYSAYSFLIRHYTVALCNIKKVVDILCRCF